MTNEQLALLLDPRREKRPRWWKYRFVGPGSSGCTIPGDAEMAASDDWQPTGEPSSYIPDWHASDDACFRDWRPVLLAAGCYITEALSGTSIQDDAGVTMNVEETYRAATLAAIEELHTTKPELLREVIARVEGGANG